MGYIDCGRNVGIKQRACYMIFMGRNYGRIDIIIAGMLVIGLIGLGLTTALSKIENYVLKWRIYSK